MSKFQIYALFLLFLLLTCCDREPKSYGGYFMDIFGITVSGIATLYASVLALFMLGCIIYGVGHVIRRVFKRQEP